MTDKDSNSLEEFESSVQEMYASFPIFLRRKPYINVMIGWHGLIADCATEVEGLIKKHSPHAFAKHTPALISMKEKYGQLVLSVTGGFDDEDLNILLDKIVSKYENESLGICEQCGREGSLTRKGWLRVVCKLHE